MRLEMAWVLVVLRRLPSSYLVPGFAMDLTTLDEQGRPYDFDKAEVRERARRRMAEEKPYLLMGSPMCTMFSKWQDLRKASRDPVEFKLRLLGCHGSLEICL